MTTVSVVDERPARLPLLLVAGVSGGLMALLFAAVVIGRGLGMDILAYTKITDDGSQIYAYDVERRLDQAITHGRGQRIAPAWSPDGEQLAYIAPYQDAYAVFVRPFGAGAERPIVPVEQINFNASNAWSPDGRMLAVSLPQPLGYQGVFVVPVDGSAPPRSVTPDRGNAFYPTWSPEGAWIAFSWSPVANSELWRVRVTGDTTLVAADALQPERMTFDYNADTAPRYSPDGAWIAFDSGRDGNTEIYLLPANPVPVDGESPAEIEAQAERGLINLTRSPVRETMPTWSPDGRRVAFLQFQRAQTRVMLVDITRPGEIEPLIADISILYAPAWRPR